MNPRAAVLLFVLGACGGDPGDVELSLDEPSATVELLPGGEVELAWTISGGDAELVITVTALNTTDAITIHDELELEGSGGVTWDGRDVAGVLVPPAVYDLEAVLHVDGDPVDSALRNLSVHGVYFTTPAPAAELTINGSDDTVDLHAVTVSQRVIALAFALDPDPTTADDEIVIDQRTIPGEFVPFERDIHFTGLDVDGAAIPEGDFTVVVDVTDVPDLDYRSTGGVVHWRPLQ